MSEDKIKTCPGCGSKAIRDDSITNGVEGAVRCTECSFCALITDWECRVEEVKKNEISRIRPKHRLPISIVDGEQVRSMSVKDACKLRGNLEDALKELPRA